MNIQGGYRYLFITISAILLSIAYLAFFGFAGYYLMTIFPSTSYRIITIFLILIILSNLYAKICIDIIKYKTDK